MTPYDKEDNIILWGDWSFRHLLFFVISLIYHFLTLLLLYGNTFVTNEEVNFPFLYFLHIIMANSFHFKS